MKLLDDEFLEQICITSLSSGEIDMLVSNRDRIFYEKVEKTKICAGGCLPLMDGYNVYLLDVRCYRLIRDSKERLICDALDGIEI